MTQQESQQIDTLAYESSTHAPVIEWYVGGSFETAGDDPEPGKPWRLDPDTGAEIHATQRGEPHAYSSDLNVGSSYPPTTFVFAQYASGDPTDHDAIEAFLREHDLWSDALSPVAVPIGGGELRAGFMFRPPERAPYPIDSLKDSIVEKFDVDDHEVLSNNHGFRAFVG